LGGGGVRDLIIIYCTEIKRTSLGELKVYIRRFGLIC